MIEHSDNNAAQVIYDTLGDDAGQQNYMHSWGITDYSPNPNGWGWGMWSPGDMAHLLALLQSGKVLNSADRALAVHLMQSVESDQRFGVGDTAPANASVAMKDGWVPGPDGAWAVNTSGIVTVGGETYIVTVYTGEQGSYSSGVSIVNHVCGAIGQALT
jgi:beta-lactamase class A